MRRQLWSLFLCLLALTTIAHGKFVDYDDEDDDYETFGGAKPEPAKPKEPDTAGLARTGSDGGSQQVTFTLEHSLGLDNAFVAAGTFSAKAQFHPQTTAVRLTQLRIIRDGLQAEEKEVFKALLEAGGYYRVRIPASPFDGERGKRQEGKFVMAAMPARCLANGGFHENFILHLDDTANIVSMEYSLPVAGECLPGEHADPPTSWKFHSMAYVRLPKEAPRLNPDVATHYSAPADGRGPSTEGPTASDPNKPPKKEKTFFQKYWMYLLPAAFVLLNNLAPPPK